MAKKVYFPPIFTYASGGIDITQSQEGSIGDGNVYDNIMEQLSESLDSDALTWLTNELGTDPNIWNKTVPGFDPNNQETWELILSFVMEEYYGITG